jgi:hypothetical protein
MKEMQKLRNKKRLTVIATIFLLTFVTGAAFALTAIPLDIAGTIGAIVVEPEFSVVWVENDIPDPEGGPILAPGLVTAGGVHAPVNVARVTNFGATNVDNRIEWAIGFNDDGSVTLTAHAHNNGEVDADIETATVNFEWGFFGAEGFTYSVNYSAFIGPLAAGDVSGPLVVTITRPANWVSPLSAPIGPLMTTWGNEQIIAHPDFTDEDIMTGFFINFSAVPVP